MRQCSLLHPSFFGFIFSNLCIIVIFGQIISPLAGQQMNLWEYNNGGQPANLYSNAGNFGQQQQNNYVGFAQPMFGQWVQPAAGHQYYQPPSLPPHKPNSYQLPYASYRGSAFSAPAATPTRGVDQRQRERLARIADESESFGSERARAVNSFGSGPSWESQPQFGRMASNNGGDGLQRILASFAEKLPKIAETMSRIGGINKQSPEIQKEKFIVEEFDGDNGAPLSSAVRQGRDGSISLARREYEIGKPQKEHPLGADLIDSMPEPSSLFSFNKLLSAFGAGQAQGEKMVANGAKGEQSTFDLKGTPIMKSEDLAPEMIVQQKSNKADIYSEKPQQQHLTPPPEPPPAPQNPLNSFLQQFGISNFMPSSATEKPKLELQQKQVEEDGNSGDLFGSLMKGKLPQMPDWLKQFGLDGMFGANGTKTGGPPNMEEPGNALAQLFGGKGNSKGGFGLSSVLGSGLDDMPR